MRNGATNEKQKTRAKNKTGCARCSTVKKKTTTPHPELPSCWHNQPYVLKYASICTCATRRGGNRGGNRVGMMGDRGLSSNRDCSTKGVNTIPIRNVRGVCTQVKKRTRITAVRSRACLFSACLYSLFIEPSPKSEQSNMVRECSATIFDEKLKADKNLHSVLVSAVCRNSRQICRFGSNFYLSRDKKVARNVLFGQEHYS